MKTPDPHQPEKNALMEKAEEDLFESLLREWRIASAKNRQIPFFLTSFAYFLSLLVLKSANPPDRVLVIGLLVFYLMVFQGFCTLVKSVKSRQITKTHFFLTLHYAAILDFIAANFLVPKSWDSFTLIGNLFFLVYFLSSVVLILPILYQKLALIALAAFHFFGLLCLTLPGFTDSFLSHSASAYIYFKGQKLIGFNSRYHVYSPNPPTFSSLLWVKIVYDDDTTNWVFLPDSKENIHLIFERERMMIENLGSYYKIFHLDKKQNTVYTDEPQGRSKGESIFTKDYFIPEKPDIFTNLYLAQTNVTNFLLPSFLRHIGSTKKYLKTNTLIKSLRCYLVFHKVLTPLEMSTGKNHLDRSLYFPFYLGDFDPTGTLLNEKVPQIGFCLPLSQENPDSAQTRDQFLLHSGLDISQMLKENLKK